MVSTGSAFNMIMGQTKPAAPEVGMGATVLMWTDRHAATIVEVSPSGKRIVVQEDHAKRTDDRGMTDSGQQYDFTPDPTAGRKTFTQRKNGAFVAQGSSMSNGTRLMVGQREHYYDYSF